MINNPLITFIMLYALALINQVICTQDTEDIYLFSPSPIISIPQNQICDKDSKIEKILLLHSLKNSQMLGWGSKCGWNLIDYENSSNISIKKINIKMDLPESIAVQENIIWIAHEKTLTAYMLTKQNEFQALQILEKQQTEYSTYNIYFSEDKKFLFVQSLFYVESYLISDMKNIKYLNTIKRTQNIMSMNISIQLNYIVIGLKEGLALYTWQYDADQQNYVALEKCYKYKLMQIQKIEFLNVTTLLLQTFVSGLAVVDLKAFLEGAPCNSLTFILVQGAQNIIVYQNYMLISKNLRYAIAEMKIQQISIFEIKLQGDYLFPIFQSIDVTEKTYDLQISLDEQSIISSSFTNINIYMRSIPNYKNRVPNIQNGEQNYVFSDFPINTNSGRRCVLKDNLLFYAKMMDGVYILEVDPYTNYLKILSRLKQNAGSYELVMPMMDPTKLIVGNNKILLYDISDLTKPVFKQSYDFKLPNIDGDYIFISKDQKTGYISGGFDGLIIIDLSDFYNPVLISSIHHNFKAFQVTSSENVQLESKEQYAFVCYRYFAVIVYDVRDKAHPKIASYIQTNGAEDLKLTSDDKYMIISDIHRGITIVNIEDPTNIFEISNIYVEGETLRTTFIFDEQYLLSVSLARGNLQLIDIRDKTNPRILQKYQYQKSSQANDVCVTSDNSIAYLTLNQQIIMMKLFSKSIQFNIDFLLIQQGNSPLKKILDMNDVLLLGQKVEIKLVQIYPKNRVTVTDIKFYDNYLQYNLPNWANFQEIEQKLTIHITNDALDKQNPNDVIMKSFLFQMKEPLLMTDFIRAELSIDSTKSNQIYQNCLKNKLIGIENLVIESQQENILGIFSSYSQNEQNHILKIIKSKIFYFPVYINVKGSLQIIVQIDSLGHIQEQKESIKIQSISDIVKIQVDVLPKLGQFQKYLYPGVLVYFNENQDTMKIEGDIVAINKILQHGGFKFANYTYHDDIVLSMTIDDTINYPVTLKFKASNQNLIQLNNKVLNNENNNIQSDFSSKFPDSSVYILSSFSYAISTKIFIDKDNDHLTYSAKIQIDGEFQQIPESYWLNFQSSDRTFYATTKASQYGEKVTLKVIASDGYTEASDILEINVSLVPVTYILQIVAQVAGPILGLLGLWRYKALLCNFVRQKKYQGNKFYYFPESSVQIQIPLLEDQLELAKRLWKDFYSQIDKKVILIEINQLKLKYRLCQNNTPTDSFFMKNEGSSQMIAKQKLDIVKTESCPLNLNKTEGQLQFSQINSPFQDSQFVESQTIQHPETPKSATKEFKERQARIKQKTQHNYIKQAKNSFIEKSRQQKKMGILTDLGVNERDSLNLEYFQSNGYLNKLNILKKVQDFYSKIFQNSNNSIIETLDIPTSRLSQSIISLCSIEIAILERTPITLLNFLRDTAIQEGFSTNTWYRAYVQIIPQFNQVFVDPFPKLIFNESKIIQQINIIKCNLPDESDTDINLYLPLVKENIKSIAYGLTFDKSQLLTKIRGESLELFTHDILCIKTYRPIKKSAFSYLKCTKKQREVYIEKELSQNSMVPSWITSVDISNGVILISGRLHQKDVGQYILKIYDTQQFIIQQIDIIVSCKNQERINQSEMVTQSKQTVHFFKKNSPKNIGDFNTEEIPHEKNNIEFKIYSYKQTQKNSDYASANSLFDKSS